MSQFLFMLDDQLDLRLAQAPCKNDRSDNRHHQQNANDLDGQQILGIHRLAEAQRLASGLRLVGGDKRRVGVA